MMILKAIFLGIVQGLTEFLPVSSTGQLIVVEHWLGISQATFGLTFDVALHLGTLVALVWYFRKGIRGLFTTRVVVATLPAVVLGLALGSRIEATFRQTVLVAWALILFGGIIWVADRRESRTKSHSELVSESGGEKILKQVQDDKGFQNDKSLANLNFHSINLFQALIIGLFQALALFPGVSRSGATISGGMFSGLERETSARFAFLLSIPIIFGASIKRFWDVWPVISQASAADLQFFLIGGFVSAIFSFLTIKYFLAYLKSARLWPFVVYRILLGLIILAVFW